ncbi:MAG: hypothetical protein HFP81_04975 [Methylococcales symbiont of Hymedesmia sp. n. MRB-2018]|nr:MAG: hypothetical protein HFP78_04275 [Methylococcales symbiont of Hymedesmia sp. n. MRB-2018]KAF3983883.1 MAG: hypothetical protein HFP81_04975 [Methylococcales symbiont of Hymedesmia sp. n. MRB-2018]
MTATDKIELRQFTSRPYWYITRGIAMIIIGITVAMLCLVAPEVYMLGKSFSWIPVIAVVVLFLGVFRCIDAISTETHQGFLVNMQGGTLDIVTGFLVLFGISGQPENLNLLIVGYLVTQGIYRNIILSVADVPNPLSNRITGFISIFLGILIWMDWSATSATWFLALSLSIDVSFRGWALIVLASAIKREAKSLSKA